MNFATPLRVIRAKICRWENRLLPTKYRSYTFTDQELSKRNIIVDANTLIDTV